MKISEKCFTLIAILLFGSVHFTNAQVVNANVPMIKLNNGLEMPQFGLGTFTASNEACKEACLVALKAGYRHIDTAHAYGNESGVGSAVKESGVPREEIWITSKIWPSEYGEGITMEAIDKMLARLQTTYIDLLYVHQPVGDFVGAWKDMEKAVASGKVRALGISNFDDSDEAFHAIVDNMKIKPVALQIECHPYAQRIDIREKVKPYNIAVECWFPLGGAMSEGALFKDPVIKIIAAAHRKTPAQIILRWHIQEGFSVIPGATNPNYIKENIEIFDFALNDDEMAAMRSLNKEKRFFNMTLEQKQGFVNMKFE
ncbi:MULTISPECIES: aldo/keto reductase [Bacteroidales]|jgi:diketogulonate reductase-like aldo/keto reductase|uniref:Diketogulonate reductase-like aldo/keto reductase n=1 Tax=Macellibacteroides fermentans TaxID=879969 RepID=A0A8E1ZTH3_9PORP|nr:MULTISPECIES: aldo/keto reductase [Bacteroidales]MBP9481745.1 aldo/keto reductase [Parabacteroides sp.]MBP9578302.1 aldo/keto reductase [Parabacteroides sp.]MDD3211902.1 aldo/keto reductase [Bacteroides graminisolvens]NYI48149.1 diketogulonate reductase-like aldo/keto reductase [Macellibacteroides fermentans]